MTETTNKPVTLSFHSEGNTKRETTKLLLNGHDITDIAHHLSFEAGADGIFRAQITCFLREGIDICLPAEVIVFLVSLPGTKFIEEEPLPDGRKRFVLVLEEPHGTPDINHRPN